MRFRGVIVAAICCSSWIGTARADIVTDWNGLLLDVVREENLPAPVAARAFAMMNVAMHDTIQAFNATHDTYLPARTPGIGALADVSAGGAARRVLSVLFPDRAAQFDDAFLAFLPGLPDIVFLPSRDFGASVANDLLALRDGDNSDLTTGYTPGDGPGEWQPTPPSNSAALLPHWRFVVPFGMASATQFRPTGPPNLTSARYTADFNEVKALGASGSGTRTADQTQIARFWEDATGTNTAAGHWIEIATTVATARGNTSAQNARVFALISLALADANICAWDAKYAFDHWRPVTAVRNADIDGNDATTLDDTWSPLITTPPHPGYVPENAVMAGAAARMMEIIYGTDAIAFDAVSDGIADVTRSYESLSEAAEEAAMSGVFGGTDFAYGTEDGLAAGRALAAYIHQNYLRRVATTAPSSPTSGCAPGGCGPGGLFTSMMMLAAWPVMRRGFRRRRK